MAEHYTFSVVSPDEARRVPYPYVYVNEDGGVRELHVSERADLEKPYSPFDGDRPCVKPAYDSRSPAGYLKGYCARDGIPSHLAIAPAPAEAPSPYMSEAEAREYMDRVFKDFEEVRGPDGSISMRRKKK